jgi:hypothetical protein
MNELKDRHQCCKELFFNGVYRRQCSFMGKFAISFALKRPVTAGHSGSTPEVALEFRKIRRAAKRKAKHALYMLR